MEKKMILSDNHVHTCFSSDSNTPVEDMLSHAKSLGLSSICFTDHIDYGFPAEKYGIDFLFSMDEYFSKLKRLSAENHDFNIRIGVELGLKKDILPACLSLTKNYPFDFVIGSTHLVDNIDPYYGEYWEGYGESRGIKHYYEATYDNIRQGFDFDVYGHIDYVIRYCPAIKAAKAKSEIIEPHYDKMLKENREILDEILLTLIQSGKGIEVNTGGLKYMLGHPNPHEEILRRYHALGGEILSIGSDAHETKHLAFQFTKIPALLQRCGFTHYTEFHKRKPMQQTIL